MPFTDQDGAHYVDEAPGNLPYVLFYQAKGGYPVFENVETWAEVINLRDLFRARGVNLQVYHRVGFQEVAPEAVVEPEVTRKNRLQEEAKD